MLDSRLCFETKTTIILRHRQGLGLELGLDLELGLGSGFGLVVRVYGNRTVGEFTTKPVST